MRQWRPTAGLPAALVVTDNPAATAYSHQLCDDVLAHVIAGYESTATALSWTLLLLADNPVWQVRLHDETVGRPATGKITGPPDRHATRHIAAVFAEALRLYPPSWGILRTAMKPCRVAAVTVPLGTYVLISRYVAHRDVELFNDPLRFLPQRWLDVGGTRLPRFAYLPFGGRRRACPGKIEPTRHQHDPRWYDEPRCIG